MVLQQSYDAEQETRAGRLQRTYGDLLLRGAFAEDEETANVREGDAASAGAPPTHASSAEEGGG